uniref:Uncharacterized protein n=1 Tax=Myoviridae sp. ctXho31 TaxID=2825122 RepID=A0A8S5TWR4_9CAUD|nr:MAG TPA: hypothetical protein [Myoviridae sp. ctXho31]
MVITTFLLLILFYKISIKKVAPLWTTIGKII